MVTSAQGGPNSKPYRLLSFGWCTGIWELNREAVVTIVRHPAGIDLKVFLPSEQIKTSLVYLV